MNKYFSTSSLRATCFLITMIIYFALPAYLIANNDTAQQKDTLDLNSVIDEVIKTHPMVQEAEEALNSANAKINLAKAGYYPTVDISASYVHLWPDPAIPFGGKEFTLYPENNYDMALNYNQSIYDFGRTSNRVKVERESKNLAEHSAESIKQQLTLRIVETYYTLLYLQEAIKIKDEQLRILQEHYNYMKKKEETGSAVNYDVLSTQVRISGVESQKLDLEGSWNTQSSILNLLMGKPENTINYLQQDIIISPIMEDQDSVISEALANRSDMLFAIESEKLAQMRIQLAKTEYNPSLHAFVSGGGKNGYPDFTTPSAVNNIKLNYSFGVSLSVPIYNASRTKNNVSLANSALQTTQSEVENTRRRITGEVVSYYQKEQVSLKKIEQFQLQFDQAQKAYNMAETNYNSGSITNLDLLDASNALAQSQLDLLKAKIDYVVNIYNLKISTGIKLYE